MHLQAYFDRVGFSGRASVDLPTLEALHSAHLDAIPFEDLDVQLARPVGQDLSAIFDKIVTRRRGGWCYEMNGLFGWVLRKIGFDVTRMAGGVMRDMHGDAQLGNHLCLLVRLPRPYLVDVGFGGSMQAPMPLASAMRHDAPYDVHLAEAGEGYWRFSECAADGPAFSFDFHPDHDGEARLAAQCAYLQSDPASSFVQNLVLQRRAGQTHVTLRGRVLSVLDAGGATKTILENADALVATLRDVFGIDEPEAAILWPSICARHAVLFGA